MDTLKIDTSQNIDIEQPIASVGERIAATIVDFFILLGYFILFMLIFSDLKSRSVWIIGSLPVLFYGLICELAMNGQTFGKKVFKIKVVNIDGSATTFLSYFLRWIIGIFEIFMFGGSVALVAIILNGKGQRIGDMAANTTLIRLKNKSLHKNIYIELPDDYVLVFPEVTKLTMKDIYTIEEVLELLRTSTDIHQALQIALKAKEAIEHKLNIRSNLKVSVFFKTIIRDYNYLNIR